MFLLKISRLIINNYRNLRNIDIHINDTVALIGENNSGKSNLESCDTSLSDR